MLTKHRRIYREELQICVWLDVWDKNQTYLQGGESGIGRTSGGWKFPELTFARWVRETSSHPRCVQSRTQLPASMFVIESNSRSKISSPKFSSPSLKYFESKSKMIKYNHIHSNLMHFCRSHGVIKVTAWWWQTDQTIVIFNFKFKTYRLQCKAV
jgi:hypothetical protein